MTRGAAQEFDQLRARRARGWRLEFDSDGSTFVWAGLADSQQAAEDVAREDLAGDHPDFNRHARLVACLER
jgi:hypothetical protein